jgi:hypothetical protein
MDWRDIDILELAGFIIPAVIFIIGMLIALRVRKKDSPQKVEDLLNHLQDIGVQASRIGKSMVEGIVIKPEDEGEFWLSGAWERIWGLFTGAKRVEGVIKIWERHINYVKVSSLAGQGGVKYVLDYLVRSPGWSGQNRRKDTIMVRKKRPSIRGKVADIGWQGDDYLSQKLNFDQRLKDILLQVDLTNLGYIEIYPDPQYARVRTAYVLPSPDLLKAIDIIARHILS